MIKLTKRKLEQIIKEELSLLSEQSSPSELYDRLVYLRSEHQGEFALLDKLGEKGYDEVTKLRNEKKSKAKKGGLKPYDAYREFFDIVKEKYSSLFPRAIRNLWDERHETPPIKDLKNLKAEHDDLSSQFKLRGATSTTDSMYGRKRTEVVHTPSGEVVNTGVDRKGSLGT